MINDVWCPSCRKRISQSELNVEQTLILCNRCETTFVIAKFGRYEK